MKSVFCLLMIFIAGMAIRKGQTVTTTGLDMITTTER